MTVLVTGATGYIGSSLVKFLDERTDEDVQILCRELPEYFAAWDDEFVVHRADITDRERLRNVVGPKIEQIVHLAAYNDVDTESDPKQALLVNGYGTRNILDVAAATECTNVVYVSTQKVYGYDLQGTFTTQSPVRSQSDYGLTHAVGEQYCQMYADTTELATNVVRPSNVFGAPVRPEIDRWTLVPACFCRSVCEDGEIRLRSSGRQKRDFVDLTFLNESIHRLLATSQSGYNAYNVTSETQLSIYDAAEIVQTAAKEVLGDDIRLIRESDEPKSANEFLVRNNISYPPSESEVQERMLEESRKMIRMRRANGQSRPD